MEPSADTRQAAHQVRELYVALLAEGFTPREALVIIGQVIASGSRPPQ
jgi:hypothetical protein